MAARSEEQTRLAQPNDDEEDDVELIINPRRNPSSEAGDDSEEVIFVVGPRGGSSDAMTLGRRAHYGGRRPFKVGCSRQACVLFICTAVLIAVLAVAFGTFKVVGPPASSTSGSQAQEASGGEAGGSAVNDSPGSTESTESTPSDNAGGGGQPAPPEPNAGGGQGVGPLSRPRCAVLTFLSREGEAPPEPIEEEEKLVSTWQLSWFSRGWRPVVLTEQQAKQHPLYQELLEKEGDTAVKNFAPWLAAAVYGGGLFAHHSVVNVAFPPPAACDAPPPGTATVFQDLFPLLLAASPSAFEAVARATAQVVAPSPPSSALKAAGLQLQQGRETAGLQVLDGARDAALFHPDIQRAPRWVRATSLLCAHFARQANLSASSVPFLSGSSPSLSRLSSSFEECSAAVLPAFQPPPFGPSGVFFVAVPPSVTGVLAAVFLRVSQDPSFVPQWLQPALSAVPRVTAHEFAHIAAANLMGSAAGQTDPNLCNIVAGNLSAELDIPLSDVPGEVTRRLELLSRDKRVILGFLDIPADSLRVLQLSLGFRLPESVVKEVEEAVPAVWNDLKLLLSNFNLDLREWAEKKSELDFQLMKTAEQWLRDLLQEAKDIDI